MKPLLKPVRNLREPFPQRLFDPDACWPLSAEKKAARGLTVVSAH
jgi:hypothetical protein